MSVRLTIETRSAKGRLFARKLRAYREIIDCYCPEGHFCDVVVEEGWRRWYDVVVTRPGYACPPNDSWFVIRKEKESRYVGSFLNPSAAALASAILHLIAVPLTQLL